MTPPPFVAIEGLLHLKEGDSFADFTSYLAAADLDLAAFQPRELRVLWINWRDGLEMNASGIARLAGLSPTYCRRLIRSALAKVRAQLRKIDGGVSFRAKNPK